MQITLEAGDGLSEWAGAPVCDAGFQEKALSSTFSFGTATVEVQYCQKQNISGESSAYGLRVKVTDWNEKLPEASRGIQIIEGDAARQSYISRTLHHGCHGLVTVKTGFARYSFRNESKGKDNHLIFNVKYEGHTEEVWSEDIQPTNVPC